jgi:copper chaperone
VSTHRFRVSGITCRRCVRRISAAVTDVPGVRTVEVDVDRGTVRVTGDHEPDHVRTAIRAAGYRLVED